MPSEKFRLVQFIDIEDKRVQFMGNHIVDGSHADRRLQSINRQHGQ